jgi:predicted permease
MSIKVLNVELPEYVLMPMRNISKGFVAVALITLGVQLAEVKVAFRIREVLLSSFIRLIIAPALGVVLLYIMGVEGILAKSLILGVATPAAASTAIFAKEFNNEPEYASQIVFISTILSSITISGIIYLLDYI